MDHTSQRFQEMRDDMNQRLDQLISFLWMLVGIFTILTAVLIGFACWDGHMASITG